MATLENSTPLSHLFTDPDVRAAFWRAEQDLGDDYAALVLTDHPRTLDGGAAALLAATTSRKLIWSRRLAGLKPECWHRLPAISS
jgi:hypothetical protein